MVSMLYNDVHLMCGLCVWFVCVCVSGYGVQLCVFAYQNKKKKNEKNGAKTTLHLIIFSMSMVNRFIDFFYDLYLCVDLCVCA